jgi:peroxiredoxin
MMRALVCLLALALCSIAATGPNAGQKIPNFSLPDQNGKKQSLMTLAGPNGLVLSFVRSADW